MHHEFIIIIGNCYVKNVERDLHAQRLIMRSKKTLVAVRVEEDVPNCDLNMQVVGAQGFPVPTISILIFVYGF